MSSQSGSVSSVINSVSSASSAAVMPATTSTAAPTTTTTTTTTVSPPLIPASTPATCVAGLATTPACGPSQTISVTTTISMVRPTAPSPTAVTATSAQTQPRPGLAVPQRIVARPQLIVRPSQQQATIQLPPGFTIPADGGAAGCHGEGEAGAGVHEGQAGVDPTVSV